ncbi:MAG: hypothetical protein JO144_14375 [Actinobacteria bacterium]|nr:hypothetical protein [Actinomycetota bacterium]
MAAAPVDVIGSTPVSFTDSAGAQQVVPLSALQFNGSDLQLRSAWAAAFDATETATLLAVARTRVGTGELSPPPVPPPVPALIFTAARTGAETNNITVTVDAEEGAPALTAKLTVSAVETDSYPGLATGAAAAMAIGVDAPTGADGDPPGGTGLVVVKKNSTGATVKPAVAATGVLVKGTAVDLKDGDGKVVCSLLPRADYKGTGGLSYTVTATATSFTVSATYDSGKETGVQKPVTLQTLDELPAPVGYLVGCTAPPSGAVLPADATVTLSGGGPGLAANGLLYT